MGKRKKKNKHLDITDKSVYKTFKIPLKTILLDKNIQPKINELVFEINHLIIHTYQFIRLYILKQYNENKSLDFVNDDFVLYCIKLMGFTKEVKAKYKETVIYKSLLEFYKFEYEPLLEHNKTNLNDKTYLLDYIKVEIITNIKVNIKEHFIQHFLRFINKTTEHITKDKSILKIFKDQLFYFEDNTDVIFNEWKNTYLSYILPLGLTKEIHTSVAYDVECNPLKYLKCMLNMCRVLELKEIKIFQCLPLRTNIIPKHIKLDTPSLIALFHPNLDKNGNEFNKVQCLKKVNENKSIFGLIF